MSSILKALKKVEEEKNARQNAAPLASDVVKPRRGRQPVSRWKIPAALAAVALVAVLSTYAVMGGFSSSKQGKAVAVASMGAASSAPAPVAEQVQPVTFPADGASAGTPAQSGSGQKTEVVALSAARQPINPPLRVAAGNGSISPATKSAPASAVKPAATTPAVALSRQPEAFVRTTTGSVVVRDNHAEFKVNGIAWQKESSSRLAVVNGVAVTQGATVDGAKVVEILPDRVRLSRGGRTFEVVLGKINTYR